MHIITNKIPHISHEEVIFKFGLKVQAYTSVNI